MTNPPTIEQRLTAVRGVFDSLSIYFGDGSMARLEIDQSQAALDEIIQALTQSDKREDGELKPCPRCGSHAFVNLDFSVWCSRDRCLKLPPRPNRAEAITAWNTRTPNPAQELPKAEGSDEVREAETIVEYGDRIAAVVRTKFMDKLDDDVIGHLAESHMIFGKACAIEAIITAYREMDDHRAARSTTQSPTEGSDIDPANRDCLAKRKPGEPIFVILGRDPDGGNIVRLWAERRASAGDDGQHTGPVFAIADAMDAWRAAGNHSESAPQPCAYPPLPTEGSDLREALEKLVQAGDYRALNGSGHVPSMRAEQDARNLARKALSATPARQIVEGEG